MVAVIALGKIFGYDRLQEAVAAALRLGSSDGATVRYLLTADQLKRPPVAELDVGPLARFDRPPASLAGYDRLLRQGETR